MWTTRSNITDAPDPQFVIREENELPELYGPAPERSVRKQPDRLDDYCRAFIAASPMLIAGTQFGGYAEASPRGDKPRFVQEPCRRPAVPGARCDRDPSASMAKQY